ncbi:GntR family transcriptional regulator [Nonomuraea soli]|uniref:DNA-binding GntR family transcriptional regulator n=1 Tax=Nonomuraea soli TaxID=1032476 RepID=A0A7W0CCQ4_9ACTN|nr:GntR family transcriptional regulator [Nonomuraea soli]MBA2888732.1 DNA-binding GntR family transcriptional regulator [Nonomuraea soli]
MVYETLKEQIIEGVLQPGRRLVERELGTEHGVSRVPVREALRRLEAERLVVVVPRKGVLVRPFTPADVADLFDVRESLEVLAARLAAAQATDADLKRLRASLEHAARQSVPSEIARANAAFHTVVVELSGNALLVDIMRPLEARLRWLFRLTSSRDIAQQCAEHAELFSAIASHDPDAAAECALKHVSSGRAPSLELAKGWSAVDTLEVARSRRKRS